MPRCRALEPSRSQKHHAHTAVTDGLIYTASTPDELHGLVDCVKAIAMTPALPFLARRYVI